MAQVLQNDGKTNLSAMQERFCVRIEDEKSSTTTAFSYGEQSRSLP